MEKFDSEVASIAGCFGGCSPDFILFRVDMVAGLSIEVARMAIAKDD